MPTISSGSKTDRGQVAQTARGVIAETFPVFAANGTAAPASGDVRGSLVGLRAGDVVANITMNVNTIGATLTHAQFALYKKDGTLLANSADSTASFTGAAGNVTLAMATPYTVPADDGYYVALFTSGTTPPTMRTGTSGTALFSAIGSGAAAGVNFASQSSLPSTATFSASSAASSALWAAIS